MNKIKFSHNYKKLNQGYYSTRRAKLLQVLCVDLANMSKAFLDYDTDNGVFELPKSGTYMMLIFQKVDFCSSKDELLPDLFTTMRRYTFEKERYYASMVGKIMEVEANEVKG